MTREEMQRETMYQIMMYLFRKWEKRSWITGTELSKLQIKMAQKYNPVIGDFLLD